MLLDIALHHKGMNEVEVEKFLTEFKLGIIADKSRMLKELKTHTAEAHLSKKERRKLQRVYRHELVKRDHLLKIAAAWVITVPVSGVLAAMLFFMIRGMMLPG